MTRTVELLNEQQSVDEDKNETSEEIEMEKEKINIGHTIYHMRCAEHTFQQGIQDAVKKGKIGKVPIKDTQNRSAPTFPLHRHCFET